MEIKQAIEVLKQAINIALGAGAFKATQDVAVIHTALEVITRFETDHQVQEELGPKEIGPKKLK
jgi:hypothetical protein